MAQVCVAAEIRWESAATRTTLAGAVLQPAATDRTTIPTIVYLKNLSIPRIGQEEDETILADLTKSGHLVLVLDYAKHAKAVSPSLCADVLKIRQDIADPKKKSLLANYPVDLNRLFILPEGFRLRRDVEFARDGRRVLGMDVLYPSKPNKPVPLLMEITCDNVNRMGSGSLLFCRDTLVEGGAIAGFATAMIDHPVPPPYKGIDDPMPQCIHRLKAAVRTLRALSPEIGTNGNIGSIGFSRGGPMAGLLAATGDRKDLEGNGAHPAVSSRVQAALVHGNRYDYLDLRADDPMLKRFEKAWGPRDANHDRWAAHGVIHYLTKDAAPMFLNTSNTESAEYRDGLEKLAKRLQGLGVEHVYQVDSDGRGHRVSTNAATLSAIYSFLGKHLR
ncbi:MAG: alpha/beta hydrolase [Tepidisphaeraceae bacterium]